MPSFPKYIVYAEFDGIDAKKKAENFLEVMREMKDGSTSVRVDLLNVMDHPEWRIREERE